MLISRRLFSEHRKNCRLKEETIAYNKKELDKRLTSVKPSKRQLEYESLEFTGFLHFTVNTFTGREWGDGTEKEELFNPVKLDAKQWISCLKSAGIKGIILTCKHHDGFCLWPSKYTNHTIAASPYKNGKGDIVREVSDACRDAGIKFGVYLSPWDRNQKSYGQGKAYDDFFVNQLTELLTNYGEVFCVWFDGACGEGPNGKKQVYDWDRYYEVIRRIQPGAVISVCGPDVRWCGNEAGDTREAEWSVVPKRCADTEKIKDNSQQTDDESFRTRKITASDKDLGSREILANEPELIWYPAEVDVSIRPGWFYHEEEDDKVKSLDELFNIYINSVGGNATLLLNVPPNREGLIAEADKKRLAELGEKVRKTFGKNVAEKAKISIKHGEAADGFDIENVLTNDDLFFRTKEGVSTSEIEFILERKTDIGCISIMEQTKESQRIEDLEVIAFEGDRELIRKSCKSVGHKRILMLDSVLADRIVIKIKDARDYITLKFVGIYEVME